MTNTVLLHLKVEIRVEEDRLVALAGNSLADMARLLILIAQREMEQKLGAFLILLIFSNSFSEVVPLLEIERGGQCTH